MAGGKNKSHEKDVVKSHEKDVVKSHEKGVPAAQEKGVVKSHEKGVARYKLYGSIAPDTMVWKKVDFSRCGKRVFLPGNEFVV